jgi:hypothetical protein
LSEAAASDVCVSGLSTSCAEVENAKVEPNNKAIDVASWVFLNVVFFIIDLLNLYQFIAAA